MGAALVAAVDIGFGEDAEDIMKRFVSCSLITSEFPALGVLGMTLWLSCSIGLILHKQFLV